MNETSTKASVNRRLVQYQCVLDIIATVTHHSHYSVLAGWQLLKINYFYCLIFYRFNKKMKIKSEIKIRLLRKYLWIKKLTLVLTIGFCG
jgi:hypothetical protein